MTASSQFFDRFYVGGLFRPTLRGVAYAASATLVVTIAPIADAASTAAPKTVAAVKVPAAKVDSRPDVVSARLAARAQGSRVEVEQLRTETASTWVNPDGTFTTEQHQGPIRFKDPGAKDPKTAAWVNVNLDVEAKSDGTAGAVGHPGGLSLAGKTAGAGKGAKGSDATDAVSVGAGSGRTVTLGWPGTLPAPALKGEAATYPDVFPGVDFVVQSRRTGFESDVVIKSAAARDALVAKAGADLVSFSFLLKTKGLTARAEKDGSVSFVDAKGGVVSSFTAPTAWDGKVDPASGNRVNESPVTMSVSQKSPGLAVLTVTPDQEWLAAPGRVFPVTIDPVYAAGTNAITSFDTFVSTSWANSTTPQTMTELRVGTYNGGSDVARSYLNFPISGLQGKDIASAYVSLYEFHSFSCTAMPVYAKASGAASTATTWGNQPVPYGTAESASFAKGFNSTCADGRVSVPVTNIARAWSTTGWQNGSVQLTASETNNNGWKKFNSLESSTDPYLGYTYNRKPNAASTPTLPGSNTYTVPGQSTGYVFTADTTPAFSSTATDPDSSQVRVTFEVHKDTTGAAASKITSCETPLGNSGAAVSCSVPAALAQSSSAQPAWYVRAAVRDDRGLWNGTWSPWRTFYVQTEAPPAAGVSCDRGYSAGTWTDTDPAGTVTCTVTAAGVAGGYRAPGYLDLTVDGVGPTRKTITATNDTSVAHATYTFPVSARGYHEIKVVPVGRSLVVGPTTTHGFGWGAASMTVPTDGTTSSGKVRVDAGGPPKGSATSVTGKVQWRVAGSGNEATGWTDAAAGPTTITPGSATVPAEYTNKIFDLTTAVREAGASADIPSRIPVRLDVQVCFTYTGSGAGTQCTWSQSPVTVTRLPHAFGAGYPVADAGVGQVAQYTGEVSLSGTDVSVPGYTGDISISRSHTSFTGDGSVANWPSDPVTGVFGPGFTASLDGGEAGLAGLSVVDNTGIDGSIMFLDEEGEPLVYVNPAGTRTYPAAGTTYDAGTDDTDDSGTLLKITGTGLSTVLTLTEEDGTATTWKPVAAPSTSAPTVWKPATITEPGQAGATTFGHDTTGRVTRIVAPVPDGMTGASCPTTGALVKGCRALDLAYATTTTATSTVPGDYTGRVKSVTAQLWDPATSAMKPTLVAVYTYDTSGRLVTVTDPRSGLGPTYTWAGSTTRIASVASASLAATKLTYDTGGRLTKVTKENPTAGGPDVTVSRFVYGVPTSGTGLPTVSDADTAYRQAKAPVTGFATFGQDYSGPDTPTGADWQYADLSYVDDLGYTVNTASYGAGGQWLVTSSDYDTADNIIRTLDASATATALTNPGWSSAQVDALSTQTLYNTEVKNAAGDVILPASSRVTDTFAPARLVALATGEQVVARPHTRTTYDEGAPNAGINPATGQQYSLATTETTGVTDSAATVNATDLEVMSTTKTEYGKLDTADATEGDGWALGVATRATTVNPGDAAGNIVAITRYDTMGRVTDTRQPLSTGTDAGLTKTAYYTVAAQSAPNSACGGKPEWAGLTCRTYPAGQPAGATLPDSVTTGFTMWLKPTSEVETSGSTTRTTTTTYDAAERPVTSKTVASGLAGQSAATARPGTYTKYDTATGLVTYTGTLNTAGTDAETSGRTTSTYDRWGRVLTQVGDAGTVTTGYDTAGRVGTVTDAKGTTTYGYDGAGERRGLTTSLTITRGGSAGTLTYGATYDADGNMTRQTLPGNLTQVTTYDEGGEPVGLQYLGQVTPVTESTDPEGNTVWTPGTPVQDQPWLTWSTVNDAAGRARFEATGTGAAFDDGTGVTSIDDVTDWTAQTNGQASAYGREYRYDFAGRLANVEDAASSIDPGTGDLVSSCTTRAYTFDKNGRRTQLATTSRPGGDCTATGTTTVATTGCDTADRPTTGKGGTGTYTYDTFGRQTSLPGADAPDPAKGTITLGYFDDDQPRSVAQGDVSTTFTLDANGRRSVQTTTDPAGTTTTTRRYTDDGDNPAWIDTTGPAGSSTTRFTESLGGDLSATIATDGGLSLSLANPHGDIVTGVDIPAAQTAATPATSIAGWATYDEYGNHPGDASAVDQVDGPLGYGWLGAKQRSTSSATAGLTLMGVRFYNAARGLFTSLDPVPGGNATAYAYPNDPVNMFDLDGRRWGWLKKAAKWSGVAAMGICIIASAGACALAGAVAAGFSIANNYRRKRTDRRYGWGSFARDSAIDVLGARFNAVRGWGKYLGKHRGSMRRISKFLPKRSYSSFRSVRAAFRAHPVRSARRVATQAYYGVRSYTGSNTWGFKHRYRGLTG